MLAAFEIQVSSPYGGVLYTDRHSCIQKEDMNRSLTHIRPVCIPDSWTPGDTAP